MMHGKTTMILSHESIAEAIEEWLQGHMASNVTLGLNSWAMTADTYGDTTTVTIEIEQTAPEANAADGGSEHG